jgi:hypothetical protein
LSGVIGAFFGIRHRSCGLQDANHKIRFAIALPVFAGVRHGQFDLSKFAYELGVNS